MKFSKMLALKLQSCILNKHHVQTIMYPFQNHIHAAHMNVARRHSCQLHASHDIHYICTEMICFHCQFFVNLFLSRSVGLKQRSAVKNPPASLRQCSGSSLASACCTMSFFFERFWKVLRDSSGEGHHLDGMVWEETGGKGEGTNGVFEGAVRTQLWTRSG